jgi:hypothetical protein
VYLILFRKIGKATEILTLVYYCVTIFIFLLFDNVVKWGLPPTFTFPLYTLLEYSFFTTLIFQQLKFKRLKLVVILLSICFLIFQVFNYFFGSRNNLDSIPIGFETILIFIFIFFFLYEQLRDVKDVPIYENYFFWIVIGLFIYLGGSFFIYLLADSITTKEIAKYWFFTYIVEIIKNLLLVASIFIYSRNPNKSSQTPQNLPNLDFML